MRDVFTYGVVLLIAAAEAALWVGNPMHIPATFVPARAFGLQIFQELGSSMRPAVRPGQYVLVSAWPYLDHEPQLGDVIAFQFPGHPSRADLKRIVAVGGSTVRISNGVTYVDGKATSRSRLRRRGGPAGDRRRATPRRVPLGSYFVMQDDGNLAQDSRDYGVIPRDHIIGKAIWSERFSLHADSRLNAAIADR
jgi:signal peptidase I